MLPTSNPEITSLSSTPDQVIRSASSTPPAAIRSSHQRAKSSSVQKSIKVPVAVLDAEIRWASKVVTSHLSFHYCLELNTLFNKMFPDSDIASKFRMSKTKCGYIVTFGMATFFKIILVEKINSSPSYSVLFDESLNDMLQTEQMDIHIRYWDNIKGRSVTQYLDSRFFKRGNVTNLKDEIINGISCLSSDKMIMRSMDGPNVNWCVLSILNEMRKDQEHVPLFETGSCGLHIVHGAFQTCVKSTKWNFDKVLKSMFNLFHASPARREVYILESRSEEFAKRFCATRWVEDLPLVEIVISVWPNVVKVVRCYQKLCKSKRPQNASYETLLQHYKDILMLAKFQFSKDVASILNPFLNMYQIDQPMMIFLNTCTAVSWKWLYTKQLLTKLGLLYS